MVKEKTINQITEEWKEEKKKYVKKSTYAAYQLLIQNHIKPYFGDLYEVNEENIPSERYVEIIQKGLRETYKNLSKKEVVEYLDCRINRNIADKAESI